jgi:Uncharacterized protein conserved in bacteria
MMKWLSRNLKGNVMKQIKIMVISKRKIKRNSIILAASILAVYLLFSLFFMSHYLFHTEINGVNVSLRTHGNTSKVIQNSIHYYRLQLIERNGVIEYLAGPNIHLQYSENNSLSEIKHRQNPFLWIRSLWNNNRYYIKQLYHYDDTLLDKQISNLKCFHNNVVEPQNVTFRYTGTSYEMISERYGTKVNRERFMNAVKQSIAAGQIKLDLDKMRCYDMPDFTVASPETKQAYNLLNKYVSAKINYRFGNTREQLGGDIIHHWLSIDNKLAVILNKQEVADYVHTLSKKYNTVGITRDFLATGGKKIELKGGLYGWKINSAAETEALYNHIKNGDTLEKEPAYLQKAFSREGNEIGNTYIEINITKQQLWFYKEGKLLAQGPVVTGNPNRGNATVLGVYMLNYKQKETTLKGPGYEAGVTYWMPFYGNIGLHDASWRNQFGGDIYKRNGTHGCVNAPKYLAKKIFENIDSGIPIILYEESK